jgi:hypothetical protein
MVATMLRFTMVRFLFASIAVAILMLFAKQLQKLQFEIEYARQADELVRALERMGGRVSDRSAVIPVELLESGRNIVPHLPRSLSEIEIVGTITSSHDLQSLPFALERIKLSVSSESLARIPQLDSIRHLELAVQNSTNSQNGIVNDPQALRSKFSRHLVSIKLSGPALSDDLVATFGDCHKLDELWITGGRNVSGDGISLSFSAFHIRKLSIRGSLEMTHLSKFPNFPALERFYLSATQPLSKEGLHWLQHSPNLETVIFEDSVIDDVSILCQLTSVKEFEILRCQLTDDAFLSFCRDNQLPRIRRIEIAGTNLTAEGLSRICDLQALEVLELDVPLSVDEVTKLNFPLNLRYFLNRSIMGGNRELSRLNSVHPNVVFSYQEMVQERTMSKSDLDK